MADDTELFVVIASVFTIMMVLAAVLGMIGLTAYRRRKLRDHVWMDIDLKTGRNKRFLIKPDFTEKGSPLRSKYGTFYPEADRLPPPMYDGGWRRGGLKPLFRFVQGDPRRILYTTKFVMSANPGKLEKVSVAAHQVIPSETVSVYLNQHDYAEAYSGQSRLLLILILAAMGLLVLLVFGLYAR